MKDYLKNYKAKIHVLTPMHIGCGQRLLKKRVYLFAEDTSCDCA